VEGLCEYCNEPSVPKTGEIFHDQMSGCQLLREDSVSGNYLKIDEGRMNV
jgi:hypothetical protein